MSRYVNPGKVFSFCYATPEEIERMKSASPYEVQQIKKAISRRAQNAGYMKRFGK